MPDINNAAAQDPGFLGLLGNIFGGAQNDTARSVVGQSGLDAASRNALLSFGTGLMSAAGPHPYRHSVGQDIAAGLQAGTQGYSAGLDNSLKGALTAQQLRMAQLNMARQQALLQAAQGILGGGGQAAPAAPPSFAPTPGGAASSPVGGMPAAPGGAASPTGQAPQPPQPAAAAAAAAGVGSQPARPLVDARTASALTLLDPEHAQAYSNLYGYSNPELATLPDGTVVNLRDQSLAGTNHAALPPGMVRGPDGVVSNAPGFAASQYELDANKAAAEHSQDLVPTVIPGVGTVMRPRSAVPGLSPQLVMGPNGRPALALPAGNLTAEDPASETLRKGDAEALVAARKEAATAAQTANQAEPMYEAAAQALRQVPTGTGATGWTYVANALNTAGLLSPDAKDKLAAAKEFNSLQLRGGLQQARTLFPGRVSNYEVQSIVKTLGTQEDPKQSTMFLLDFQRAINHRAQAYSDFLSNYSGDPKQAQSAWAKSPEGTASVWSDPVMWKHLPVLRGKAGTPVAGKTFVKTPSGKTYEVQLDQYGEPVPVEEQ